MEGGFHEKGGRVLSHSTIRALRRQGLESVGGSHSDQRGHPLAFDQWGLAVPVAITASGQLAPTFSLNLGGKIGRSGA